MNIPWKYKSKVFRLIDIFHANSLLYFIQKNITKRSRVEKLEINLNWVKHSEILLKYQCTTYIFEFGAGKNLAQNLFLSNFCEKQLVVDLNNMVDIALVERSRALISTYIKLKENHEIKSLEDLSYYGICYRSPYNASKTDLIDKCIDACVSTNTLEHIPKDAIKEIFNELHRILKDSGIVSAVIDYTDHYAHTDSSITLLNYLNYSDLEWKNYNHKCHFQNRLRHDEYRKIFLESGFKIISEDLIFSENDISPELQKRYMNSHPSWCATSAHFVLKKEII